MNYRFWDMDHTICDNDCDVSWKEFLIATGRAPVSDRELVDKFYADYANNLLEPDVFMAFQLREFIGRTPDAMRELCLEHFRTVVQPQIYPQAQTMIRAQLAAGDALCLLTATNRMIAAPLAEYLGIPAMVATELEIVAGRFTGRIAGTYNCGEGKVTNFAGYCREHGLDPAAAWYYGDSTSDQHILERVGHPVAANPMPKLRMLAEARHWEILDFRSSNP